MKFPVTELGIAVLVENAWKRNGPIVAQLLSGTRNLSEASDKSIQKSDLSL